MTSNLSQLDEKAVATADLLIQSIFEAHLIEEFYEGYEHLCHETLARFNVVPKKPVDDDFKRVLLETLCFAAFTIMSWEIPKHIRRWRLYTTRPDMQGISRFNDKLLERFLYHIEAMGMSELQEVEVVSVTPDFRYDLGQRLSPARRIGEYSAVEPSKAAETFSWYFAHGIDPEQYAALKILGMHSAERVVELARIVVRAAFREGQQR
jgi:hypothetical protein